MTTWPPCGRPERFAIPIRYWPRPWRRSLGLSKLPCTCVKIAGTSRSGTCGFCERREEITTEGGLDVATQTDSLRKLIRSLKDAGLTVSLFIDPSLDQVRASHKCDADRIELHTGRYCDARRGAPREQELTRIVDTAKMAAKLGMGVAAGHGLNYDNVEPIARISEIDELNIGHAIVARAVLVGFDRAVREMIAVMHPGS